MLKARKTTVKISDDYSIIIDRMCTAAFKLWNVCNYERHHYKELDLPVEYPNWYYQKKAHKDDMWSRQLPAPTAQEVCKLLDKSWKAFYKSRKTEGGETQRPPKFKHEPMAVNYNPFSIVHKEGSDIIRLTLSKKLKEYVAEKHDIHEEFLYLQNRIFTELGTIKQIILSPPKNGECEIVINCEVPDTEALPNNGRFLSIDLGLHNLMTCYNSYTGETFIVGRKYLSICHYFDKEIARIQTQWANQQRAQGIKHPKSSKHIKSLHEKKRNSVNDFIHKLTRTVVDYCRDNDIRTVVIGDIKGIREEKDFGSRVNQALHALPYDRIYKQLEYKLREEGFAFVKQEESYTSQTSPLTDTVSKENAERTNRIKRGLYTDGEYSWNADVVGAFNILRLYLQKENIDLKLDPMAIRSPYVMKVPV